MFSRIRVNDFTHLCNFASTWLLPPTVDTVGTVDEPEGCANSFKKQGAVDTSHFLWRWAIVAIHPETSGESNMYVYGGRNLPSQAVRHRHHVNECVAAPIVGGSVVRRTIAVRTRNERQVLNTLDLPYHNDFGTSREFRGRGDTTHRAVFVMPTPE